jgi:hypothetical protein
VFAYVGEKAFTAFDGIKYLCPMEKVKSYLRKPLFVFVALFLLIAIPLFTLPINLFPGEIIYKSCLMTVPEQAPMSLAYFIGLGYNEADMVHIESFRLLPQSYFLAFFFLFGFPGLGAYRVHLANQQRGKGK